MTGFEKAPTRDQAAGAWSRRALLGGAAALTGAALAGCHHGASTSQALRVALTGKGELDVRLLLQHSGIKPDFPISFSYFESGHLIVEALNAGGLDFGGMSEIPPSFAAAGPAQNFRQIGVLHGDVNNQVVLVPKGSPIQSLSELKGKRVGYVRATTAQYFLIRMLQSVGLGWGDIQPVAMTVADAAQAFDRGSLDAWAIYGFPIQRAIATQGARVLTTAKGFLSGNYAVAAHKDAIADPVRRDWIARFLKLQVQTLAWAKANQDAWAQVVAREIGVPVDYVLAQFHQRSDFYTLQPVTAAAIASEQAVADVFAAQKLLPHRADVRPLWDDSFNPVINDVNAGKA
ncbi:ABC transporter substrate-binding protein [Novosphingobium rosa]|uniref:ABC transporter substrate-binding protein n=1 Tax=Novosphingobium rosa TaxID=76978 RepID=UPI0008353BC8|nr:ABC transporter substrate-binding protein [Novosphingobium rosa]